MTKELLVKDSDQVLQINRAASKAGFPISLCSGYLMVNARSLLGVYTLVGKRATVLADDKADPQKFAQVVDEMAGIIR